MAPHTGATLREIAAPSEHVQLANGNSGIGARVRIPRSSRVGCVRVCVCLHAKTLRVWAGLYSQEMIGVVVEMFYDAFMFTIKQRELPRLDISPAAVLCNKILDDPFREGVIGFIACSATAAGHYIGWRRQPLVRENAGESNEDSEGDDAQKVEHQVKNHSHTCACRLSRLLHAPCHICMQIFMLDSVDGHPTPADTDDLLNCIQDRSKFVYMAVIDAESGEHDAIALVYVQSSNLSHQIAVVRAGQGGGERWRCDGQAL